GDNEDTQLLPPDQLHPSISTSVPNPFGSSSSSSSSSPLPSPTSSSSAASSPSVAAATINRKMNVFDITSIFGDQYRIYPESFEPSLYSQVSRVIPTGLVQA